MNNHLDAKKALKITAGLCSKKEYCCSDIQKKLDVWEITPQEQTEIIAFLIKNKFIDEERFATFYARDKFRFNKWGKQKIAQMLKQKNIASNIITAALSSLNEQDYDQTCLSLLQQKRKSIKDTDSYQIKAKLFRFGLSRGFDYDTVNRTLEHIQKNTE